MGEQRKIKLFSMLAVAGAMLAAAPDATARVDCPDPKKSIVAPPQQDRCRASYVDIFTDAKQWETLRNGEAWCFVPPARVWEWKCRGYTEAARCRGLRTKGGQPTVRAEFRDNQVVWQCFGK